MGQAGANACHEIVGGAGGANTTLTVAHKRPGFLPHGQGVHVAAGTVLRLPAVRAQGPHFTLVHQRAARGAIALVIGLDGGPDAPGLGSPA